jgi:hypothetical protein
VRQAFELAYYVEINSTSGKVVPHQMSVIKIEARNLIFKQKNLADWQCQVMKAQLCASADRFAHGQNCLPCQKNSVC